jgi:hypothetical protein
MRFDVASFFTRTPLNARFAIDFANFSDRALYKRARVITRARYNARMRYKVRACVIKRARAL